MSSSLLEYETEMFVSVFSTDGLLITAEGLGIDRILLHFMRVYSEEGSLVLLLNTTTPEQVRQADLSWYTATDLQKERIEFIDMANQEVTAVWYTYFTFS